MRSRKEAKRMKQRAEHLATVVEKYLGPDPLSEEPSLQQEEGRTLRAYEEGLRAYGFKAQDPRVYGHRAYEPVGQNGYRDFQRGEYVENDGYREFERRGDTIEVIMPSASEKTKLSSKQAQKLKNMQETFAKHLEEEIEALERKIEAMPTVGANVIKVEVAQNMVEKLRRAVDAIEVNKNEVEKMTTALNAPEIRELATLPVDLGKYKDNYKRFVGKMEWAKNALVGILEGTAGTAPAGPVEPFQGGRPIQTHVVKRSGDGRLETVCKMEYSPGTKTIRIKRDAGSWTPVDADAFLQSHSTGFNIIEHGTKRRLTIIKDSKGWTIR